MATTWDPANKAASVTLSGGNLTATSGGAGNTNAQATVGYSTAGKRYFEYTFGSTPGVDLGPGFCDSSFTNTSDPTSSTHAVVLLGSPAANLKLYYNGSAIKDYGIKVSSGDVLSLLIDLDADTLEVWKNGVSAGSATGLPAISMHPLAYFGTSGKSCTANFGATAYAYTPTAGYDDWVDPVPGQASASLSTMTAAAYQAYGNAAMIAATAAGGAPATGAASFLPMEAHTVAAVPNMEAMTAVAHAHYAVPTMEAMTATSEGDQLDFAEAAFEAMTVAAEGQTGSEAHSNYLFFAPATATGEASAASVASGDVDFEAATARAYGPQYVDISFEELAAAGTALPGTVAAGDVLFQVHTAQAEGHGGSIARGTPVFPYPTAEAYSLPRTILAGAASFQRAAAAATGLVGTISTGTTTFEALVVTTGAARATNIAVAAPSFAYPVARGLSQADLSTASRRTWALQTDGDALTEYTGYNFDSLAAFNGTYYGVGPDGIFELDGDTDDGEDIAWRFRTGLMDAGSEQLKALEEVLLAMRFDGPVRVRIWTDDNSYYDYNVSNFRPDVIQQVRAKLGRGARSRFYRVEVSGVGNVAADIHSMQVPMITLNRRVG